MGKLDLYILINFGYVIIFGILTAALFFLNMPNKEKGMEGHRKSRYTLGMATGIMALYCLFRIIIPQHHGDYIDFWLLVTFTLVLSWLTFSSFLFLIETPRYHIRHFIADGLIPVSLMLSAGTAGMFLPSMQKAIMIIFGCTYGIKCCWMLYTCLREYRKCRIEIDNYYDEGPDTRWMHITLILSFIMSIFALVVFYVPELSLVFYICLPMAYLYLIFKVISFSTKKIENIRKKNLTLDIKPEVQEKKEKTKDLSSKIGPLVEEWVSEKKFCKEGLTIKDVAMQMGTNQSYLSQYINNCLNQTFQVWLNTLRIEESKILLASEEKISIEEIGIRVGIPQNYNFSRWFRAVTDMTPFQYRREILSGKQKFE